MPFGGEISICRGSVVNTSLLSPLNPKLCQIGDKDKDGIRDSKDGEMNSCISHFQFLYFIDESRIGDML